MHSEKSVLKQIVIHVCVWIAYILYESLLFIAIDSRSLNLWETGLNFSLYAGVFYLNSLLLWPRYYRTRKYVWLCLSMTAMIMLFLGLRYFFNYYLIPRLSDAMIYPVGSMRIFIAESIWRLIYFVTISFVYFFASSSIRFERERRILEEEQRRKDIQLLQIEKGLKEAEVNYLKTQINPHFLFNSLNFFYAQVYPLSEDLAKGILLLSDIMRYALKEESINGKVMLEDELKHLQDYISLNQLRFNHTLQIQYEVVGQSHYRMVMPLLLITFVENGFKHGDLQDPDVPFVIRLEITHDQLILLTHNKKKVGHKEKSTGIGLSNTQKRLDLWYPNQYEWNIEQTHDTYFTKLTINL